jgi:hypothetical protein
MRRVSNNVRSSGQNSCPGRAKKLASTQRPPPGFLESSDTGHDRRSEGRHSLSVGRLPRLFSEFGKPSVRSIMLNMCRVNPGDEHIDLEEKPIHGNSLPSCCTNSDVSRGVPGLTGSRGIPFRVFLPASDGHKARRARVEITSPTVFCWVAANSLAAASTSSSMVRVVRKWTISWRTSNINHHTSSTPLRL